MDHFIKSLSCLQCGSSFGTSTVEETVTENNLFPISICNEMHLFCGKLKRYSRQYTQGRTQRAATAYAPDRVL